MRFINHPLGHYERTRILGTTWTLILSVDLRHTLDGSGYGPNHPNNALSIYIFLRDTSSCKGFVWSKSDESCNLGDIVDPGLAGTKLVFIRLGGLNHLKYN